MNSNQWFQSDQSLQVGISPESRFSAIICGIFFFHVRVLAMQIQKGKFLPVMQTQYITVVIQCYDMIDASDDCRRCTITEECLAYQITRCVSDGARNVLIVMTEQTARTRAFALFSARSLARRSAVPPVLQPCKWMKKRFVDGLRSKRLTSWKSAPSMSSLELDQKIQWVISDLGRPHSFMAFDAAIWPMLGTLWVRGHLVCW